MTSSVGIVGHTASAPVAQPVAAPGTALEAGNALSLASVIPVSNPRVVVDPVAGLVTQFTNSTGSEVVTQFPSAAAVAYLRIGLDADGLNKQSSNSHRLSTTA